MRTQTEIRKAFWYTFFCEGIPSKYKGKRQNDLPTDLRIAFVEYVDDLCRDKVISEKLASKVTL